MRDRGREVLASKATAERQFVIGRGHPDKVTNVITDQNFRKLLEVDRTPTKKYIHAILRWLIMPSIDFVSGKDRSLARHLYWNLPEDPLEYEIQTEGETLCFVVKLGKKSQSPFGTLDCFDKSSLYRILEDYELAQSRRIPVRDPNSFTSISDFEQHLDRLDDQHKFRDAAKLKESLKDLYTDYHRQTKNFIRFLDNSDYFVLGLLDFDASNEMIQDYMGEEPHWCVARQRSYWEEYRDEKDCCFYWVVSKKEYKACWMVQVTGYHSYETFTIWDWEDNKLNGTESSRLLKNLNIKDIGDFEYFDVPGKKEMRSVAVIFVGDKHLSLKTGGGLTLECSDLEPNLHYEFMDEADNYLDEEVTKHLWESYSPVLVGVASKTTEGDMLSDAKVDVDFDTVDHYDPREEISGFDDFVDEKWSEIIRVYLFTGDDIQLEVSPAWLAARGVSWPKNFSDENYKDYERALEGWFRKYHCPVNVTIHSVYGQVYVDWSFFDVDTPFGEHSIDLMDNSYLISLLHLKLLLYKHPEMTISEITSTKAGDLDGDLSLERDMVNFTNTWLDRYYR